MFVHFHSEDRTFGTRHVQKCLSVSFPSRPCRIAGCVLDAYTKGEQRALPLTNETTNTRASYCIRGVPRMEVYLRVEPDLLARPLPHGVIRCACPCADDITDFAMQTMLRGQRRCDFVDKGSCWGGGVGRVIISHELKRVRYCLMLHFAEMSLMELFLFDLLWLFYFLESTRSPYS